MKAFHILVEWPDPDQQPWLIYLRAASAAEAVAAIESNDEIRSAGGKVAQIDEAPPEPLKDLVMVDPETGERDNCGVIAEKRMIGEIEVWLTYDEPNRFWWIVWKDDKVMRKLGFVEDRREACWETFADLTDTELAKLRSS